MVIVLIGGCCFYFRGCFTGQERQTVAVVQAPPRQENRVAAPPPPRFDYEEPAPPPEPRNNIILDYFDSQKVAAVRPQ